MSSIKQVQDLEKQMDRLRRENISLRRMLSDRGGHADVDMEGLEHMPLHLPEVGSEPRRRHRHSPLPELERAREKARIFGKGIWKPPAPYGLSSQRTLVPSAVPDLPPKSTTDHLLHFYYKSVHSTTPMLHWPTFQRDVDDLYRHQQPLGPSWLSMFFAVLALGSLFSQDEPRNRTHQAVKLIEISRGFVDPWNNDYTLDDVRAMILTAMLLNELNLRSASWAWVGSAARVAQDLGLHLESGPWTVMEAEMRRRVWWTIYILDRSLSLELGRPMLIDDADCEALLPAAVDDHFIHEGDVVVPAGVEPLSHFLLAIINVVRSYPALIRAMATPAIAPTSLSTFDQHFDECRREFPPACDPSSDAPLPAQCFIPLTYLLHARLVLHRHNLSPACPTDVRVGAIDQCTHTALETASLLMRTPTVLATTATALVTTHVFRCTLFLLLAGYLEQAINCIRVLSHIGENRDVATACGSFLSFFVYELERKRHDYQVYTAHGLTGTPPQPFAPPPPPSSATSAGSRASREGAPSLLDTLLRDEEMIAYVSSDLQANPDAAWLWAGAERDVIRSPPASAGSHRQASPTAGRGSPSGGAGGGGSSLLNAERRMGLSVEAARQWQGWERLEAAVRALVASETTTPTSAGWNVPTTSAGGPTSQPPPPPVKMEGIRHSSIDRVGGPSAAPPRVGAGDDSTGSSPTGGGGGGGGSRARSKEGRISIADIM